MMTPEDLGRMSTEDIRNAKKSCAGRDSELWTHLHGETDARLRCFRFGRAGESAIASRAQVRVAGSYQYLSALARSRDCGKMGNIHAEQYEAGFAAGLDTLARALLGLAPDAPSPLEDD